MGYFYTVFPKVMYNINDSTLIETFMNHTITTTLSLDLYNFLVKETKRLKTTKKAILETALREYKKQQLREAVHEGLKDRQEEYRQIAAEFRNVYTLPE